MKYFLVGIKGTGMSALACLLSDLGNKVEGSDEDEYYFTEDNLIKRNIIIHKFNEVNLDSTYIYIIGNAFNLNNKEVQKIINNNYTYYYYHDFIGNKLNKEIIAVSGTHGKTTTTKFLYQMVGEKTSVIIGDGTGKGYIHNNQLILEACEYKNHFLSYNPSLLIITNIELDHSDYFDNIQSVINSFDCLVKQSDIIIANGDDKNICKIKCNRMIKVGMQDTNDIVFNITKETNKGYDVHIDYIDVNINIPFLGIHFVYDYILSYVACYILGLTPNTNNIKLPKRRLEETKYGNTILVNDYGHHPTEIKAVHDSLRLKYDDMKINVIFQPHTYSRTLKFKKEFKNSLSLFDDIYIDKVFTSKREGYDKYQQLKIDKIFKNFKSFDIETLNKINKKKREIWVFLGAGSVDKYMDRLK